MQPKQNDDTWKVTPNLWGGLVASSGFGKTPAMRAVMGMIDAIQRDLNDLYEAELAQYKNQKLDYDQELVAWKHLDKQARIKKQLPPIRPTEPTKPIHRVLTYNNATPEALIELLKNNPGGALFYRDELLGWMAEFEREGRQGERALYLTAHDGGDAPYSMHRIERGDSYGDSLTVSILGGFQPETLSAYLPQAAKNMATKDDGFFQRLQVWVYPDFPQDAGYVDEPPNRKAMAQVEAILRNLFRWGVANAPVFRFAPDAQDLFIKWSTDLDRKLTCGKFSYPMDSHMSKFKKLMTTIAVLYEVAQRTADELGGKNVPQDNLVNKEHTLQAIGCCDCLESHATRIYSCIISPQMRSASVLLEKIKEGHFGGGVNATENGSLRVAEIYTKGWKDLGEKVLVERAVEVLVDTHHLRVLPVSPSTYGGRPTITYEINPRIFA
jgi:putative DNA primase/helicase